ncbi:MAG: tetratricopeptide repeat protein [Bacteroidales bacterium]|nr:tetratricopeptide repeat protein [Bacteroidales bacterium]
MMKGCWFPICACFILLFSTLSYSDNPLVENDEERLSMLLDKCEKIRATNPDSAVIVAQQALSIAIKINKDLSIVQAEHLLGYCYYSRNDFDLAITHLEKSLEIARRNNFEEWIASGLNRLGNVYQLKSNNLQAFDSYKEALQINQRLNNKHEIARTLVNLGSIYNLFGSYQKSIEYFLEALAIYENLNEQEGVAWTSLSIARLFKRLGLHEKAIQYAKPALQKYQEIEQKTGSSNGITLSLTELGNIYFHLGLYDKAIENTQTVLDINTKKHNIQGQAANHLSLGIICFEKGDLNNAEIDLNRALELKKQVNDSLDLSMLYRYLGETAIKKNNLQSGIKNIEKGLSIANKHHLLSDIKDSYLSLSKAQIKSKNYPKALEFQMLYSALKDSINSSEIARLEMQYDFDKREKEQEIITKQRDAVQQAKLERQRMFTIFTAIALVLTIMLTSVIFYYYREKKKTNQVLLVQKNEIEKQKQEIENQRDIATRQRDQIADQQRLITDSIRYASRIQSAVFPRESTIEGFLKEYFILYKPKNIVSGDFYWVSELHDGRLVVAAADCTGHGVPGAFMSMLSITLLKELTATMHDVVAGDILFKLRSLIISSLSQTGKEGDSVDGLDMSIAIIDRKTSTLEYAGAFMPILICRKMTKETQPLEYFDDQVSSESYSIFEIRANKMPIGYYVIGEKPFTTHRITIANTDTIYLMTDGYCDQFGGANNTKFLLANFKKLLLNLQHMTLQEQKKVLKQTIETYQGGQKQVDDILVLGFRV